MEDIEKSYCARCNYETNHNILFKERKNSNSDDYDYIIDYMVVKCMGCERISFRRIFTDLEICYPDQYGNWISETIVTTFPEKIKILKSLKNTHALPEKINTIYEEAIDAFNANCLILTGVAFRTVIEAICIEEKVPGSNLEKKINNLVKQKLITEKEAKRLHSIRFIGNDSVHEMKVPKIENLKIVLNIIEHLLNNIYLMDFNCENVLETIIDEYQKFENLINQSLTKLTIGDEVPLAKILNKNVRRFNGNLDQFEKELIDKINKNTYCNLSIGKIDKYGNDSTQRQHFIITKNTD